MDSLTPAVETTVLLREWQQGQLARQNVLFDRLYTDLHRLARQHVRQRHKLDPLSPTSLVLEAYLRLHGGVQIEINDRHHFFALAARTMRRILTDRAKRILALRQGGGSEPVELNDIIPTTDRSPEDLVAFDEALDRLGDVSPRLVMVAELLVFGSLQVQEIAAILDVSRKTISRDMKDIEKELKQLGYVAESRTR